MERTIGEWRRGEGGRILTRDMPAKYTSVCARLSEWDGSQVVVFVEICFISNDINGTVPLSGCRASGRTHLGLQSACF